MCETPEFLKSSLVAPVIPDLSPARSARTSEEAVGERIRDSHLSQSHSLALPAGEAEGRSDHASTERKPLEAKPRSVTESPAAAAEARLLDPDQRECPSIPIITPPLVTVSTRPDQTPPPEGDAPGLAGWTAAPAAAAAATRRRLAARRDLPDNPVSSAAAIMAAGTTGGSTAGRA